MQSHRMMIEDLIAEYYDDGEIVSRLRKKGIQVTFGFVKKVRSDMFEPLSWANDDSRWDNV